MGPSCARGKGRARRGSVQVDGRGDVYDLCRAGIEEGRLPGLEAAGRDRRTPEAAVVKTDAPPMPPFGVGSKYRAIADASAASTGTTIAFRAKMKDTTKPRSKTGIVSCVP
jgi:hypothetical protein